MKNLYEFLIDLYSKCEFKNEIDFDKFVEGFLDGSFGVRALHEAFWFGEDYLGNFTMDYKIDHENKNVELFFESRKQK